MLPRFHIVSNDRLLAAGDFPARASALVEALGPAIALHLRAPQLPAADLHALAAELAPVALRAGSLLLVNDRVDIALAVRAGAHLRAVSLPVKDARRLLHRAPLGYSAHALQEAALAEAEGADYVFLGTIYGTASHPGLTPAGPQLIADSAPVLHLPVIAIGGITPERVPVVWQAGAAGVAVLAGVWDQPDPVAAAQAYLEALGACEGAGGGP